MGGTLDGTPDAMPGARRRRGSAMACLTIAAMCLSTAAAARVPDKLTGYGKLLFGMSTAEVEALTGGAAESRAGGLAVIETAETIAGMPATRTLVLADGRLSSILFDWTVRRAFGGTAGAPAPTCRALFDRLFDQVSRRYGAPAIGANPGSAGDGQPAAFADGEDFAATSFWSFPDGASIALIVRGGDAAAASPDGRSGCRATVNYKEPPVDAAVPADLEDEP